MLNSLTLESLCVDLLHWRPQAVMPGVVQYLSVNSGIEGLRDGEQLWGKHRVLGYALMSGSDCIISTTQMISHALLLLISVVSEGADERASHPMEWRPVLCWVSPGALFTCWGARCLLAHSLSVCERRYFQMGICHARWTIGIFTAGTFLLFLVWKHCWRTFMVLSPLQWEQTLTFKPRKIPPWYRLLMWKTWKSR